MPFSIKLVLSVVLLSNVFYACGQEKNPPPDALGAKDAAAPETGRDAPDGSTARADAGVASLDGPSHVDGRWPGMTDGALVPADALVRDGAGDRAADTGTSDVVDAAAGKADVFVVDANLARDLAGPQPSICHGRRTNLTEDPMNCGACGNVCAAYCSEGVCADACQLPLKSAGSGVCADPRSDPRNCGGYSCNAAQACQDGGCVSVCKIGEALCGGACVVLSTDNKNCGSCGQVCPTGTGCAAGVCLPCKILFPALPVVDAPEGPTGVLTADLDGDGKLDLVATSGGGVGTFLGNGDGTFAAERRIAANVVGPMAAADVDGDGKIDVLAVSPEGDAIVALPGLGDGSFGPSRSTPVSVSVSGKPLLADFNADGRMDVAMIGAGASVNVLLGTTGFDWAPAKNHGLGSAVTLMDEGDLDGDGKLDLVVASASDGRIYALSGVGDGTIKAPQVLASMAGLSDLALGDLDNDGKAEIVLDVNGEVWVLRRSASGDYPKGSAGIAVPKAQGPLLLADVDSDDRLDVVVGSIPGGSDVHVLRSASYGRSLQSRQVTPVGQMDAMAVGDVNGDGRLDLVMANRSAKALGVFLGLGQGMFRASGMQGGDSVPDGWIVGDLDQDGLDDILGHKSGYKLLSIFSGMFGWGMEQTWDIPAEAGSVFGLADLNGDGKQDIVIGSSKAKNIFFLMSSADHYNRTLTNFDSMMNALVLGDWNGDGKLDFAAASQSASDVTVVPGQGGTSLGIATHYPVPSGPSQIFAVDLDGDGKKDLLVAGSGSVSYLASQGDGTFAAAKSISSVGGWIELGDFDENGIVDFAALGLRDGTGPAIGVFLGLGGGAFAPTAMVPYDSLAEVSQFSVGDVDGDGHLDMMLPGSSGNRITFWLGRGDGTFGQPTAPHPMSKNARLADLDHDGRADLIVYDRNGFDVLNAPRDCARRLSP